MGYKGYSSHQTAPFPYPRPADVPCEAPPEGTGEWRKRAERRMLWKEARKHQALGLLVWGFHLSLCRNDRAVGIKPCARMGSELSFPPRGPLEKRWLGCQGNHGPWTRLQRSVPMTPHRSPSAIGAMASSFI